MLNTFKIVQMKYFNFICFGFLSIVSLSCVKQPIADFSTNKTTYTAGDTVFFTNKCKNAVNYKWTMPDGQTSTSGSLSFYTINSERLNGTLSFTLEALSKNKNKSDQITKTIIVNTQGQLTIWTSYPSVDTIKVTVDSLSGFVTKYYAVVPDCGSIGCFNLTLGVGTHTINATMGGITWPTSTITIFKNSCSKFELKSVSSI